MSSPYMSSWRWSDAPLPMRTGLEPRYPSRWVSSISARSVSPRIPNMMGSPAGYQGSQMVIDGTSVVCPRILEASRDEAHVSLRLRLKAHAQQNVDRKRRVADPGKTIVLEVS